MFLFGVEKTSFESTTVSNNKLCSISDLPSIFAGMTKKNRCAATLSDLGLVWAV